MRITNTKLRKISFSGLGMLLFIAILNLIFGWFRFPFVSINPFEAVPNQTALFLEVQSTDALLGQFNPTTYSDLDFLKDIQDEIVDFKMLLGDSISLEANNAVITFQKLSAQKIAGLYIFDVDRWSKGTPKFEKRIKGFAKHKYNYQGTKYESLKLKNGHELAFYQHRNLLLVSRYPLLLEEGIKQLEDYQSNIRSQKDFQLVQSQESSGEARLFVNVQQLPNFLKAFYRYQKQDALNAIANFADWVVFDIEDFAMSNSTGYLAPSPSRFAANNKEKISSKLYEIVPDNAGFIYAQQGIKTEVQNDSVFQRSVSPWFKNDWALAISNPGTTADRLLILKTKDQEFAHHYLEKYGRAEGELLNAEYQTFTIRQLMNDEILQPFVRQLQLDIPNPFYSIINEYVVFSNSEQSLEILIDKHIVGQNLASNLDFLMFLEEAKEAGNSFIYFNSTALFKILEKQLTRSAALDLEHWLSQQQERINGGIGFSGERRLMRFETFFENGAQHSNGTDIAWRLALPANISSAPKALWNPISESHEIIVQDDDYNLFLINKNGEILWKRRLHGPLLSTIHEIDYQEDGSSKLLFNTADNIYLLNRDGNDMGNYPLRLQSKATNGMCVVDFKKNLDYQIFIACENGHAYGFTKDGNPIPGWNPKRNVGRVKAPFQHFQYRSKDFLVLLNDAGKLSAFNSEGKATFKNLRLGKSFASKPEILNFGEQKVIALTNDQGEVKIVNNKGVAYNLTSGKSAQSNVKVTFANILGSPREDMITLVKDRLVGYSDEKKHLQQHFEIKLNAEQDEIFKVQSSGKYANFGTLCRAKKEINLFSAPNLLHQDFPLQGTTPFTIVDLFKNNEKILVVGVDNSVYAYRLGD